MTYKIIYPNGSNPNYGVLVAYFIRNIIIPLSDVELAWLRDRELVRDEILSSFRLPDEVI